MPRKTKTRIATVIILCTPEAGDDDVDTLFDAITNAIDEDVADVQVFFDGTPGDDDSDEDVDDDDVEDEDEDEDSDDEEEEFEEDDEDEEEDDDSEEDDDDFEDEDEDSEDDGDDEYTEEELLAMPKSDLLDLAKEWGVKIPKDIAAGRRKQPIVDLLMEEEDDDE